MPADPASRALSGQLLLAELHAGSKSAHRGVLLRCADGSEHLLRRPGANPFKDELLQSLAGRSVRVWGHVSDALFIVERYELLD
jgi:hypothetical protein